MARRKRKSRADPEKKEDADAPVTSEGEAGQLPVVAASVTPEPKKKRKGKKPRMGKEARVEAQSLQSRGRDG